MLTKIKKGQEDLLSLLNDPETLNIFKKILTFRVVSRTKLTSSGIAEENLDEALEKLEGLGLIKKNCAQYQELDKFYPTSEGLEFEKSLF